MRRITVDLDRNQVIQDEAVSGEISVRQLHEKLPAGVETIETLLVYRKVEGHQDPGQSLGDQLPRGVPISLPQQKDPEEDARLVDSGMKRGLEDPAPNDRLASKSKVFGVWRADDNTEWGDKRHHPIIARHSQQRRFANLPKLLNNDCYHMLPQLPRFSET